MNEVSDFISPPQASRVMLTQTPILNKKRIQPSPSPVDNDQSVRASIVKNRIGKKRRLNFSNIQTNYNNLTVKQMKEILLNKNIPIGHNLSKQQLLERLDEVCNRYSK